MQTIEWQNGSIRMIDQTRLPQELVYLDIDNVDDLVAAIKRLSVRGAPALGVAGAYGVALAAHKLKGDEFDEAVVRIRNARPTAVNLGVGVDLALASLEDGPEAVLATARALAEQERESSWAMGRLGADLLTDLGSAPLRVMTICNTGGLATVERGTALSVILELHDRKELTEALPLETRPLLQGGRLTTWELGQYGAPHRLLVDSAGPALLSRGLADAVVIGADRVAANGDTANKIGSYSLALAASRAEVPFVVVAPETTIDMNTPDGASIEIEDRGPTEVAGFGSARVAPDDTDAVNPAFDVTPVDLITALVTDKRVVRFDRGETL